MARQSSSTAKPKASSATKSKGKAASPAEKRAKQAKGARPQATEEPRGRPVRGGGAAYERRGHLVRFHGAAPLAGSRRLSFAVPLADHRSQLPRAFRPRTRTGARGCGPCDDLRRRALPAGPLHARIRARFRRPAVPVGRARRARRLSGRRHRMGWNQPVRASGDVHHHDRDSPGRARDHLVFGVEAG